MTRINENTTLEEFRKLFPTEMKREIKKADDCIDNHTKPQLQNLSHFYMVINILEQSQRLSIIVHRELILEQIRAGNTIDDQQIEKFSYKATLLVLQDAFEHKLPALHGDYASCGTKCDYAKYANHEYADQMAQQLLAQAASIQHSEELQK